MNDEQIMKQVAGGDIQQMAVLFERYNVELYNYFLRITYDPASSEDLTMNVFERIIKYRRSYKNLSSFKAWMFQIARNCRNDHFRRSGMQRTEDIDNLTHDIEDHSLMEGIREDEKVRNLERAMASLKNDHREVLYLTRYEKMKYADVAEMFDCAEGTIKAKVHRAIKELRDIYLKLDTV